MVKNYCYLNNGLTIVFNGENISENGLKDLLEETIHADDLEYPIIHLKERISKIALTKRNIAKNTIRL
jgi:topoisomerase-4 subunit B